MAQFATLIFLTGGVVWKGYKDARWARVTSIMAAIAADSKSKVEQLEKDLGPLEWTAVSLPSGGGDADGKGQGSMLQEGTNRWVTMVKNNPLIPVGMLMTCGVFARGMKHYYNQDSVKQNKMMRARIGAQFATLACMVVGVAWMGYKDN